VVFRAVVRRFGAAPVVVRRLEDEVRLRGVLAAREVVRLRAAVERPVVERLAVERLRATGLRPVVFRAVVLRPAVFLAEEVRLRVEALRLDAFLAVVRRRLVDAFGLVRFLAVVRRRLGLLDLAVERVRDLGAPARLVVRLRADVVRVEVRLADVFLFVGICVDSGWVRRRSVCSAGRRARVVGRRLRGRIRRCETTWPPFSGQAACNWRRASASESGGL